MTDAAQHGEMMLSVLAGEEGRLVSELENLVAWLANEKPWPDVILLSNVMLIGVVRRLKAALGRPVLCSLQGEAPFLDQLLPKHRERAWRRLAERVRDIDGFLPVSHDYGRLMAERLGIENARLHVVHNGIDLAPAAAADTAPQEPTTAPTIGYVARLCEDKGLPLLVDAFLQLKKRGRVPGLRLSVGGVLLDTDRALLASLERRLEKAGVRGDVEFHTNMDQARKWRLLRSVQVLSVPAHYGESFGLYVLEALACGVPVVQPNTAAFPELIEETGGGVLFRPHDVDSLSEALEGLLTDTERARELGRQGRRVVEERFTAVRMAEQVASVCAEVCESSARTPASSKG